jgi:hypothetical protein
MSFQFSNFKSLPFSKEQRSWVWLILLWMHPCKIPYLFFWCFSTLCLTPSTLNVLSQGPLLFKNILFMYNWTPLRSQVSFFWHPFIVWFHFVIPFLTFLSICSSPSFLILWCHLGVFLLLIELWSFPNQNNTLIWILTNDVQYWECLLGKHLILGCSLRTLA